MIRCQALQNYKVNGSHHLTIQIYISLQSMAQLVSGTWFSYNPTLHHMNGDKHKIYSQCQISITWNPVSFRHDGCHLWVWAFMSSGVFSDLKSLLCQSLPPHCGERPNRLSCLHFLPSWSQYWSGRTFFSNSHELTVNIPIVALFWYKIPKRGCTFTGKQCWC